jgi:hypothetical protein
MRIRTRSHEKRPKVEPAPKFDDDRFCFTVRNRTCGEETFNQHMAVWKSACREPIVNGSTGLGVSKQILGLVSGKADPGGSPCSQNPLLLPD